MRAIVAGFSGFLRWKMLRPEIDQSMTSRAGRQRFVDLARVDLLDGLAQVPNRRMVGAVRFDRDRPVIDRQQIDLEAERRGRAQEAGRRPAGAAEEIRRFDRLHARPFRPTGSPRKITSMDGNGAPFAAPTNFSRPRRNRISTPSRGCQLRRS